MEIGNVVSAIFGTILKITVTVVAVIFIYKGAMYGYEFGYHIFQQEPMALGEGRTVTVTITEDMSVKQMGELFKQKGLINDTMLFMAQYYLSEYQQDVKPGTYELSTSMTVEEMMGVMAATQEEEDEAS